MLVIILVHKNTATLSDLVASIVYKSQANTCSCQESKLSDKQTVFQEPRGIISPAMYGTGFKHLSIDMYRQYRSYIWLPAHCTASQSPRGVECLAKHTGSGRVFHSKKVVGSAHHILKASEWKATSMSFCV